MASKGTFPDGDTTSLEELVAKRILKGSALSGMLGRITGVNVWPASVNRRHRNEVPSVHISRPSLAHSNVRAFITAPGMDGATVRAWLEHAGLNGIPLGESWGNTFAEFPADVSAGYVVEWAIAALKAMGASPAEGWRYEGEKPDSD